MSLPTKQITDGIGAHQRVALAGTGVTAIVPNHLYTVTLSLSGVASVVLTPTLKDITGSTVTSGNSNSVVWKSLNPNVATVSAGTVTAVGKGMAVIEAQFAAHDNTHGIDTATGNPREMVYVQINVTVNK